MKEPIICIYGIKDLRTDKIIYIGQTKNPEKYKEQNHNYYLKNKDKHQEYYREYYKKHKTANK